MVVFVSKRVSEETGLLGPVFIASKHFYFSALGQEVGEHIKKINLRVTILRLPRHGEKNIVENSDIIPI